MQPRQILALTLAFLLLAACAEPRTEETPATEQPASHSEIAWFEGTVEEAFAHAKEQNKPLFFYWGAVWCPPCHYLKTKIFTQEDFVARTRGVVPVYLDGDTERAQIYGEQFGAKGYPTVILFSPAGEEITRLPSELPVDRYAEVLEKAMSRLRPIKDILNDVQAAGNAADPVDLNLLAFYAWGQDHEVQLPADEKLATFQGLYRQTPGDLTAERSRFLSRYLVEAIRRARGQDAELLDAEARQELLSGVNELLTDAELGRINLDLLLYWSRETAELLHPAPGPERSELVAAWQSAVEAVEADESLSVDDRLSAILPRLWLARLEGDQVPEALRDYVRERIAWAGEAVTDQGELQAVMSTMAALLEEASLTDEAEVLLSKRLEETLAPYYYMSWIASMKREKGENAEALEWYRRAYDSASGRYTRFRWGSLYLRQRLQLAPDDVETLAAESLEVLDELLTFDDAFAGGNYSRLGQLESALKKWQDAGHDAELLASLRDRVHSACNRYPEGGEDDQRGRCLAFLQVEGTAAS